MSIGSRIKARREELGITQVQLADMLGVTKGAVGNYESGANSPKASMMYKVFEVLKADPNYFFQDDSDAAFRFGMEMDDAVPPLSEDARAVAVDYDRLDAIGKKVVRAVIDVELERVEE